jgi:hypothetical protein
MNYSRINKGLIIIKGVNLFIFLSYIIYLNSNNKLDLIKFQEYLKFL